MDNPQTTDQPSGRPTITDAVHAQGHVATNTTTKTELLIRAREAVDAGSRSLRDAAEALGLAEEDHSASQREMAEAVGRSPAWVNALLKWRKSDYEDSSPFDRARSRLAAKQARKAIPATTTISDDAEVNAAKGKAKLEMNEEENESATRADAPTLASKKLSAAVAKRILITAIDESWDDLDDAGRNEVANHIAKKVGEGVS
jgi:hypothetical protein